MVPYTQLSMRCFDKNNHILAGIQRTSKPGCGPGHPLWVSLLEQRLGEVDLEGLTDLNQCVYYIVHDLVKHIKRYLRKLLTALRKGKGKCPAVGTMTE